MNRTLTYLLGPELVLVLTAIVTCGFCSRHNSGEDRDVEIMTRLIWFMPFIITPFVFAAVCVPGAKNWWGLARAILLTFIAVFVCGWRISDAFGTGLRGQDGAVLILVLFGSVTVALAVAVTGAMTLTETRSGVANWFQAHRCLGLLLTPAAAGR